MNNNRKDGETVKKRFFVTQIIVFILLTACLVGVTYSWSTRPEVKGGYLSTPMTFTYTSTINGNDCSATTYQGTVDDDGTVTYPENVDEYITSVNKVSHTAGDVLYFKTIVKNASAVDTNVSLLIDVNCDTALDNNFSIGTTYPTLKEIAYSATAENKWIPVLSQYEIKQSQESVTIEWYVKIDASGQFGIDSIILANN